MRRYIPLMRSAWASLANAKVRSLALRQNKPHLMQGLGLPPSSMLDYSLSSDPEQPSNEEETTQMRDAHPKRQAQFPLPCSQFGSLDASSLSSSVHFLGPSQIKSCANDWPNSEIQIAGKTSKCIRSQAVANSIMPPGNVSVECPWRAQPESSSLDHESAP